jgi:Mn-dependent DtxR family transcriptional regulator
MRTNTYGKYMGVSLTGEGIAVAENIRQKHSLLAEFLKMIGVDENIPNTDAEGIEHHIHSETLKKLEVFVNNVKNNNELEMMKIRKNK